jgi:hypothetical protein
MMVFVYTFSSIALAGSWGKKGLWKDKRAEVVLYDSEMNVLNETMKFKERIAVHREKVKIHQVNSEGRLSKGKKTNVLRMIISQNIQTKNHPINRLASLFVPVNNPQDVMMLTINTQDWMGNTFKRYLQYEGKSGGVLETITDRKGGEDAMKEVLVDEETFFEEQLPLSLRALKFENGFEKTIYLVDELKSTGADDPQISSATLRVAGEELIRSYAGSIKSWKVVVIKPSGTDTYWFDKKYPNVMTKMETADGRKRLIHARSRWAFWDHRIPMPNILK